METRNYQGIEPLLGEFRAHLRLTSHDLDGALTSALKAGVNRAEHEISTVIALSGFTLQMPFHPSIQLRWPIVEVTSVKVDGVDVPAADYHLQEDWMCFEKSVEGDRVEVVYKAGFEVIPDDVKYAVFLLGGRYFNNPTDTPEQIDRTAAANLLRPFRCWGKH